MKHPESVLLLVLILAGCDPQQPQAVPSPPPSEAPQSELPAPPPSTEPAREPAAPEEPASAAAPPSAGAATASIPAKANEPAIAAMALAIPSAKMTVAADVRYSLEGSGAGGQPITVHVAAIPRVPGTNLKVSIQPDSKLKTSASTLAVQKVEASGVYRQQWAVTRLDESANDVRVLVTMDMPEGTAFGFFTIPLEAAEARDGNTAQKSDSVKQR